MKLLVINGPNLNLLGVREPGLYGTLDYKGVCNYIEEGCRELGVEVEFYQSNHEGDLVDVIQQARGRVDGLVLNPGAYTHTSIAILDALKAVKLPAAEVHITDINQREEFRKISYAGMACQGHFIGQGVAGYRNACKFLRDYIAKEQNGEETR